MRPLQSDTCGVSRPERRREADMSHWPGLLATLLHNAFSSTLLHMIAKTHTLPYKNFSFRMRKSILLIQTDFELNFDPT